MGEYHKYISSKIQIVGPSLVLGTKSKILQRKMLLEIFLGFAQNVEDALTFYVLTVHSSGKQ